MCVKLTALLASLAILAGCAVTLIPELPILGPNLDAQASAPGESKVLYFNNSNKLAFGIDNTGKVGVSINGKGLAILQMGEYVQASLPRGMHKIDLVHVDMLEFRSTHEIMVGPQPVYVEVFATLIANELKIFAELPVGNYMPVPFRPYVRR